MSSRDDVTTNDAKPFCESRHGSVRRWRRASVSICNNECVEVGRTPEAVVVRDSKASAGFPLSFGSSAWGTFLDRLRGD